MDIRWIALAAALAVAPGVGCDKKKSDSPEQVEPPAPEAETPPPEPAQTEPQVVGKKGAVVVTRTAPNTYEVKHVDGAFTLTMSTPATPAIDVATVPIENAGADVEMTQVMAPQADGALGLTWGPMGTVLSKDEVNDDVIKAGLDGGRDNMLASMGAKLTKEEETTLAGAPARKLEAGTAEFQIRAWLLYVPKAHSMLALMAVGMPGNTAILQKVDDMANSLKLE